MDGNQGRLMITYGKPHKEVSSDTLSRWIKGELSNAGIDVTIFQAHISEQLQRARPDSMG